MNNQCFFSWKKNLQILIQTRHYFLKSVENTNQTKIHILSNIDPKTKGCKRAELSSNLNKAQIFDLEFDQYLVTRFEFIHTS